MTIKYCQSCIERGFNPPNQATREWQAGIYYCEECFQALINNLTNIAPESVTQHLSNLPPGPILEQVYKILGIPTELQFDSVDTTCRHYDKIFNFHAPAVINRPLEELQKEVEQLSISIFQIKYKLEPLTMQVNKLKEVARKEKGLTNYQDSKEEYAKGPKTTSKVKQTQEEKMAKTLGMSMDAYKTMVRKAKEREFNKMAGNCLECGGTIPCALHPS